MTIGIHVVYFSMNRRTYANNGNPFYGKKHSKKSLKKMSESSKTHGMYGHPVYAAWANMKYRCLNPNAQFYHHYGGRGITVCDRWLVFENFRDDMLPTWQKGLSLERTDNDEGYSPENCQWTTMKWQARNRRMLGRTFKGPYPKMSACKRGKKLSAEHKRNITEGLKRSWAKKKAS